MPFLDHQRTSSAARDFSSSPGKSPALPSWGDGNKNQPFLGTKNWGWLMKYPEHGFAITAQRLLLGWMAAQLHGMIYIYIIIIINTTPNSDMYAIGDIPSFCLMMFPRTSPVIGDFPANRAWLPCDFIQMFDCKLPNSALRCQTTKLALNLTVVSHLSWKT